MISRKKILELRLRLLLKTDKSGYEIMKHVLWIYKLSVYEHNYDS